MSSIMSLLPLPAFLGTVSNRRLGNPTLFRFFTGVSSSLPSFTEGRWRLDCSLARFVCILESGTAAQSLIHRITVICSCHSLLQSIFTFFLLKSVIPHLIRRIIVAVISISSIVIIVFIIITILICIAL